MTKSSFLNLFRILTLILLLLLPMTAHHAAASAPTRPEILNLFDSGEMAMKEYGDYNRALFNFLRFIRAAEPSPDEYSEMLMKAYSAVSIIYGSYQDYSKASKYNRLGLELSRRTGNRRYQASFLTNLASCMTVLDSLDAAEQYADLLPHIPGDSIAPFNHLVLKGDIARLRGHWEEAAAKWQAARLYADSLPLNPSRRAYPYSCLAAYYDHRNIPDSQLLCLDRAYTLAADDHDPYRRIQSVRQLMQFHTRHGNTPMATKYQDQYFALTDSLMNLEDFIRISSTHEKNLLDDKIEEVGALILTVSGQRKVIAGAVAILLLLATLLIIIWRQKRNLNRTYRALYERTREVAHLVPLEPLPAPKEDAPEPPSTTSSSADDDALFAKIETVMAEPERFCSPDFSLATITSLVGSNTAYVSRVINLKTGQNVRAYINSFRIAEACRRIDDRRKYGHMTLQAIGESVGYNTQVNFNRMFKASTGMTPSIYMKLSTEKNSARPN